jgi:hypothetical protein
MNKYMNIVNFEKYLLKNKINNDMENHKNILDLLNINWRKYIKLNTKKYCKNCIFRNDKYELYIISWMPKQYTNLHSHPKNGCIMKILNGSLNEIRIKIMKSLKTIISLIKLHSCQIVMVNIL